jgi:hypothetical protein
MRISTFHTEQKYIMHATAHDTFIAPEYLFTIAAHKHTHVEGMNTGKADKNAKLLATFISILFYRKKIVSERVCAALATITIRASER